MPGAVVSSRAPWKGLRVLVTGATSGIGRSFAARLARNGATVLAHGRSRERVGALVAELGASAEGVVADLASIASTVALAGAARAAGPVDVVVHNAGVGFGSDHTRRETSADGFELRFAVNYLAPFVLTRVLLAEALPLRAILHVASIGQEALDFDDLLSRRHYDGVQAYRRSKLALIMHTFDLAEAHPTIVVNALHPGTFLDTGMVRDAGIRPLGPPSRGAEALEHVLTESLRKRVSGTYFDETTPARAHEQAYGLAARLTLRERTIELLRPLVDDALLR